MFRSKVSNNFVEKIIFLPDEITIDVAKSWCNNAISDLRASEQYGELLDKVTYLMSLQDYQTVQSLYPSRFITMSVGDIKELINVCEIETFCCTLPYNYDALANKFLEDKLGVIKIQIELLMAENKIDETFELINSSEGEYLRKLSLLYMKFIYSNQINRIIEDIKVSRRKTINLINGKLY